MSDETDLPVAATMTEFLEGLEFAFVQNQLTARRIDVDFECLRKFYAGHRALVEALREIEKGSVAGPIQSIARAALKAAGEK